MKRASLILLGLFILIEAARYFFGEALSIKSSMAGFLHWTNLLLLLLALTTLWLQKRSLDSKNPHVFVRSVMGGMIIKMFILLGGLAAFLLLYEGKISRRAVIFALAMYFGYLITEVTISLSMNRSKNA